MVTSYYIHKLNKNNNNFMNIDVYFQDVLKSICNNTFKSVLHCHPSICRICLQKNNVSIVSSKDHSDVVGVIRDVANIVLDEGTKICLCNMCLHFVNTAVTFKKIARHSDDLLRQTIKEEKEFPNDQDALDENHDNLDIHDDGDSCKTDQDKTINVKLKQRKITCLPKVTCEICNKVVSRAYYKHHITMHNPNQKNFICEICGKSFRLQCAYYNHSRRHENGFRYRCKLCPYRGRYAELLKTHMRTHTGDYKYMCSECPARFLFKSNLNSHMFKHKEPQHRCSNCKRAFHTKLILEKHFEADHLGIKNHICDICGKAFGYRNAMMKHQRAVHKREKFGSGRMPAYLQVKNICGETTKEPE